MIEIMTGLRYYSRKEWGARTDIPRLGYSVNRLDRTELIFHHTVIIDNDATPNFWETLSEVFAKMRQLQTIRPDLGLDVPYSLVIFFMADGTLVVCEGRGLDRTGAHTYAHNTRGIGVAGEGNFELPANLGGYAPLLSRLAGWLKIDMGMENLGSSHPTSGPNAGAIAFGHRDFTATSCNGANFYKIIPSLTFAKGEEDDMPSFFRNPKGNISIATAQGRRHISRTEWGAWAKAGAKYTQLTDSQYNAIPDYRNVDASLARGIVLALGTGQMNTAIKRNGGTWKPPVTLNKVIAAIQPKAAAAIVANGGKIRQWCREAIVSSGIEIPKVHNAILAAITGIPDGGGSVGGLTFAKTVEAVKKALKEGSG
jgi:hypothetical protein